MSLDKGAELELKIQKRIFAFLREMVEASDQMLRYASTEDGTGIRDVEMHERAMVLVDLQSDVIDFLIELSGESEEKILLQLETSKKKIRKNYKNKL